MSDQKQKGRKDSWKKLGMDLTKCGITRYANHLEPAAGWVEPFRLFGFIKRARALRRAAKKRSPK